MSDAKVSPTVPETLEGWAVLHGVYRLHRPSWNRLGEEGRRRATNEAAEYLAQVARPPQGESAAFSLLGHKGDLLFLHFRPDLAAVHEVELGLRRLALAEHLEETTSYVSYVELGLYELTTKIHEKLVSEGLAEGSDAWAARMAAELEHHRERMRPRLFTEIPRTRYLCFYPMNKRRGESVNWYFAPFARRQEMMRAHGFIGRRYGGRVTQVITGSIGFDDWEWGVYLFADDPLVFKKLVYEMRFDEASALYGEFGPFYVGLRFLPEQLGDVLSGRAPAWVG